jgi:membrane protein implicated in regulation of membrane protease activity
MIFGISAWLFWLIFLIVFLLVEAFTFNMTTIWFAAGSLTALILALLGQPVWLQASAMVLVSAVMLLIFIFVIKPRMSGSQGRPFEPTNADRIIGQEALVIETLDPVAGSGLIKVKGQTWSSVSEDRSVIQAGSKVTVIAIQGVKAVVKPIE